MAKKTKLMLATQRMNSILARPRQLKPTTKTPPIAVTIKLLENTNGSNN